MIPDLSHIPFFVGARWAAFGQILYLPGASLGPRRQRDFQLVLVYSGEARIWVDGVERVVEAGQVTLLHPDHAEYFQFSPTTPTHHSWCSLHPDAVSFELRTQLENCSPIWPIEARLQTFIELGLSLESPVETSRKVAIQTLVSAALGEYTRSAAHVVDVLPLPDVIMQAKRLIETEFAREWTVTALARQVCVTPTYLVTLFHRHLGVTPARYLWQVRTQHGAQLLRDTGFTVAEIAERVGFTSPFHFSRLVKQQYGVSPRRLRAEAWEAKPQDLEPEEESEV